MKIKLTVFAILMFLMMLPITGAAQVDNFGKLDTVYADLAKINDLNWSVTISYSNDENIVGLSLPFKMTSGLNRIVADSAVYTGGRTDHFAFKGFRPDTAIQCVTLGLVGNLGPTNNVLKAGNGRIVTIFVSSIDNKPIEMLAIDTTTTKPNNRLMTIADRVQGAEAQDTIPIADFKKQEIYPAFVVRQPK